MAKIEDNPTYMEGRWSAKKIIPIIEKTDFKSLEGALLRKHALISKFEKDFGFSREMDEFDGNYAFNVGMFDEFESANLKEEE